MLNTVLNYGSNNVRRLLNTHKQAPISLLIFLICVLVYLANNQTLSSNDNIPHSLLAFHWLEKHTLNLDDLRGGYLYGDCLRCRGDSPYYLVEAPNGHLTSTYPMGTALITFPIYFIFFIALKLWLFVKTILSGVPHPFPDIVNSDFNFYRILFEKLAATISTAFAVVLFYLATRLKFSQATALIATFVYAFATSIWVSSSQGLRQHTISNLVVTALIFCVLKANRTEGNRRKILLLVAGIFCGLLPSVRVTSLLFAIAILLYAIFAYRKQALFLLLGFSAILLNAAWNFYYFGFSPKSFIVGGYSRMSQGSFVTQYYDLTPASFIDGSLGLLVSPNFGLFIFSPILLLAIAAVYQVFQLRANRDEQLLICLLLAAIVVTLQYCVFTVWTGGNGSYGPRYMTDILPVLCFLIPYFFVRHIEVPYQKTGKLWTGMFTLFLILLLFSTFVQVVGVFGQTPWGEVPTPIEANRARIWDWEDGQIPRHTHSLYAKFIKPIKKLKSYQQEFNGAIEQITDAQGQPLHSDLKTHRKRMILHAFLRNTCKNKWYGYQTGMTEGVALVQARFFTPNGKEVKTGFQNTLYVSGMPRPGDAATAIGAITFPKKKGDYKLTFELAVQGLEAVPLPAKPAPFIIQIQRN